MVSPTDRYLIIDLDSRNGTFVNGTRVNQAELKENDIIAIGHATFRLTGGELIEYVGDGCASLRAGTVGGAVCRCLPAPKVLVRGPEVLVHMRAERARGPVPHPVGCHRVPSGQREPVPRACREGDARCPLVPGFHRPPFTRSP
jgi:hypothetical protein